MVVSPCSPVHTSWYAQAFHVTFGHPDGRQSEAQVGHSYVITYEMHNLKYFWTRSEGLHCMGGLSVAACEVA